MHDAYTDGRYTETKMAMLRSVRILLVICILVGSAVHAPAEANHVRIRTLMAMEPYGRMTTQHWGSENGTKRWNTSYGFTPGLEAFVILSDLLEVGAGFRYQIDRQVFRDGGSSDESFSFLPVYAATRFKVLTMDRVDIHAVLRLGYAFFDSSGDFRQIWLPEGEALTSVNGGMYGSISLGGTFRMLDRHAWGLDYSMDAGYAYHGAAGHNSSGKTYPMSYQSMECSFSLDWRF